METQGKQKTVSGMDVVRVTLLAYNASLSDDGFIVSQNGKTVVQAVIKRGRLVFQGILSSGPQKLYSGPVHPGTVREFVSSYWFWKPIPVEEFRMLANEFLVQKNESGAAVQG